MVEASGDPERKTRCEKVTRIVNANAQQKINEDSLVEDARSSLLAHYSSKSSNETAILLGLAVAFFAAIQAYGYFVFLLPWVRITVFTFLLEFILFLCCRQVGRLVYWGELADAINVVGMLGEAVTQQRLDYLDKELDDMKEKMLKEKKDIKGLEGVNVVSSPTFRLNFASSRYVEFYRLKCKDNRWNPLIQMFRMTNDKWFPIYYAYIAIFVHEWLLAFAYGLFS